MNGSSGHSMSPAVVTKRILSGSKERGKRHLSASRGCVSAGEQNRAADKGIVDFGVESLVP